ncbi:unnamed protein product [Leuciscus chuanchicus]
MGSETGDLSRLTIKHGCKCMPEVAVSVEDCLIAVSAAIGGANIKSASRMNKAIVFFLSESQMVDELIETESMKCFVCGEFGHVRQTCPRRDRSASAAGAENSERSAGADVAATAVASEPQLDGAISAPGDLPEGRPVPGASGDGLVEAVEEETGPSHVPAVTQAETSPGQVCLQAMSENNLISEGKQTQPDGIENDTIKVADDSLKLRRDDILSQESVDLMDDSDNEHDYTEIMGNDAEDSELVTGELLFLQ